MEKHELMEPPKYDLLIVKFRGDKHEMTLPYCEVANGKILDIANDQVRVEMHGKEFTVSYNEFVQAVEEAFDTKSIVSLAIQKENSYDPEQIL